MDEIEREVLDFMNVESFSQLPITRSVKEKPIRLFGKEFGGGDSTNTMTITNMSEFIDSNRFHDEPETNMVNLVNYTVKESHIGKNDEINRKYECHYCFRSFPTSQALGGHQNAHKKERQNAKRLHLQSSIVHEPSIYGITNRHCLGEVAAATRTHHHSTWTSINNNTPRFYGNGDNVNVASPINGSPLAFWQNIPPTVHHNNSSSSSNLVFCSDDLRTNNSPMVKISSKCESKFGYEPKGEVQDHVNLDLHL